MSKQFNTAVLIGRFQIPHLGHDLLLRKALEVADQVVIIIGSSFQSRNPRNPFKWNERQDMLYSLLTSEEQARVHCIAIRDYYNDSAWGAELKSRVAEFSNHDVVLVGHKKAGDKDTYYLENFPEWHWLPVISSLDIDATKLRDIYFEAEDIDISLSVMADMIPSAIKKYLKSWSLRNEYQILKQAHIKIKAENQLWSGSPYPVIFTTADAVVRCNQYVLLGKRKFHPGKDLWALPGGYLEPDESLLSAAIRELKEETQIGLLDSSLLNDFKAVKVFDHPKRSCRARVITHAHFFDLSCQRLPMINGSDDLAEAKWVEIAQLKDMEELFFDDHFHILNSFLQLL